MNTAASREAEDETQAPLVLVVEDNPDIQYLWQRYLGLTNCRVVSTAHGREALDLVRDENPAAVVLDVMLPDTDGWSVLEAIKRDHVTRHIPVVMCSALSEPECSTKMGAHTYLRKPVSLATFLSAMASVGIR